MLSLALVLFTIPYLVSSSTPLLAYSYPKPFPGLESNFTRSLGSTIIFLPTLLHPCGTLTIFSAPSLLHSDFSLLSTSSDSSLKGSKIKIIFNHSPDQLIEEDIDEMGILNWSKGWRNSCGPGDENREIRVVKLDGVLNRGAEEGTAERGIAVGELDRKISVTLASLPTKPHNNVVFLTVLSPSALMTMFDIVSSTPSSPDSDSSSPTTDNEMTIGVPRRTIKKSSFFGNFFAFVFKVGFVAGLAWGVNIWWKKSDMINKRRGMMMLPLHDDELELDLEAE